MPAEKSKVLKYMQGSKSLKMAHTISVDIECLVVKHDSCANHLNNLYTNTISTHVPCGYSSVNNEYKANYHTYYSRKDCMEKLSKELLKIGYEIIEEEKHDMIPLTINKKIEYKECKECRICSNPFNTNKKVNITKILKRLKIIPITQVNIEVLHIIYVT